MRKLGTFRRFGATGQWITVRGLLSSKIALPLAQSAFRRRLPRILKRRSQFVSHCRELKILCRESGWSCRAVARPAANLTHSAAFWNLFASNFSAFARYLNVPAANLPPPAAFHKPLPARVLWHSRQNMVGRVTPCAPFPGNPAPARRGLTRPTCGQTLTRPVGHPLPSDGRGTG